MLGAAIGACLEMIGAAIGAFVVIKVGESAFWGIFLILVVCRLIFG